MKDTAEWDREGVNRMPLAGYLLLVQIFVFEHEVALRTLKLWLIFWYF